MKNLAVQLKSLSNESDGRRVANLLTHLKKQAVEVTRLVQEGPNTVFLQVKTRLSTGSLEELALQAPQVKASFANA